MEQNGKITAPVSMYDVQQVLSDSSTDLATLCKSSKINKWSVKKPIYYPTQTNPKVQQLTDTEFRNQNYGLVIDGGMSHHAAEVIRLSASNTDFRYIPINAPYRLTDFEGYDHNMQSWFGIDIDNGTSITRGNSLPCSFLYEYMGLDLDFFSRMEYYGGGNQHEWCVGFIMNPTSSWTTSTGSCWVCICGRIDEVLGDDKFRIKTSTDMATGNYYVMPVIFSASSVDSTRLEPNGVKVFQSSINELITGEWRYMPCNLSGQNHPVMITLTAPTPPQPSVSVGMTIGEVVYDFPYNNVIRITSLPVTLTADRQYTFNVTFTLYRNAAEVSKTNVASGTTIDIAPITINTDPLLAEDVNVNMDALITIRETGEKVRLSERIIES